MLSGLASEEQDRSKDIEIKDGDLWKHWIKYGDLWGKELEILVELLVVR